MKTLRQHRIDKNIPISDVAKFVGISSHKISAIERGLRKPSMCIADKISEYYGVTRDGVFPYMKYAFAFEKSLHELEKRFFTESFTTYHTGDTK